MKVEITAEGADDTVVKVLTELVHYYGRIETYEEADPDLIEAMHMVIAYFSVPGEYMDGLYDS